MTSRQPGMCDERRRCRGQAGTAGRKLVHVAFTAGSRLSRFDERGRGSSRLDAFTRISLEGVLEDDLGKACDKQYLVDYV